MSSPILNSRAFAKSAALVWAVGYTLCAAAVALSPGRVAAAFSYVMHIDLTGLGRSVTWVSYLVGLLISSAVIALYVGLSVALYNRSIKRSRCERCELSLDVEAGPHGCHDGAKAPKAA